MKNKRFEKVYTQGSVNVTEIWVDTETGVNYMYHTAGYGGGLTPLLDAYGNVVVTRLEKED
ncbi:MAG: xylan 1,4-beta-xylosidase [Ruminococcus sp.]|nr:xylan 1,4-beta-xylosidase [Oscillospiraceae bacterium]MBR2724656.1 xylan 1,4-beta-xylosidase [Ruminococcus sp.]